MEYNIIDKKVTRSGLSVTVEFLSKELSYDKTFATYNPEAEWIENEIKAELENMKTIQKYADTVIVVASAKPAVPIEIAEEPLIGV